MYDLNCPLYRNFLNSNNHTNRILFTSIEINFLFLKHVLSAFKHALSASLNTFSFYNEFKSVEESNNINN